MKGTRKGERKKEGFVPFGLAHFSVRSVRNPMLGAK